MSDVFESPLRELKEFEDLDRDLNRKKGPVLVSGCMDSQKVHLMYEAAKEVSWKLVVTYDDTRAREIYEDFRNFEPGVSLYPARDLLFFNADIHGNLLTKQRMAVFRRLMEEKSGVVVTTFDGLMDHLLPLAFLQKQILEVGSGQTLDIAEWKEKLVELAEKNARMVLTKDKERIKREEGRTIGAVKELQNLLGLTGLHRMEAYDISNTNGFESVGSMVVYEKGKPKRNDYRKFKIKGVKGANDYASMNEVLTRRFGHGLREKEEGRELGSFTVFPDLILMDGGKGQVNIALEVLDKLNLDIPVCGMVKDDHHRTRGLYYHNEEIPIDRNSEAFRLITRIQDEAHRFAITFHRQLRSQGQVHSILDDIPGVGPARRKDLMKHFANIEAIKNATVEELKSLPSMNEKSAKDVYDFFH